MSKRGAGGHFERWPGSVKVSGKKFFTLKNQLKNKKVFARNPKGTDLDCALGEAIFD
jgi:hypothetical protein